LTDDVIGSVQEPVLSALVMGKAAEAHERGVELVVGASGPALSGELAVQDLVTVLGNLLDNAIDAAADAPAPRRVELLVDTASGGLNITVQDSGKGIDPTAVDDVFRYGYSTKTAGPFGRGLGLALVKQAVQRLAGSMTISNSSTGGARFTIALPADVAANALPSDTFPPSTSPSSTSPSSTFASNTATPSLPEEHT
jgi:sensor histidine kinase regulating citrate/malate metabolism